MSFYAYAQLENPTQFRNELFVAWNKMDVLGRIYVAKESINAQLSLPADCFYDFKNTLDLYPFLQNIRLNVAVEQDDFSFLKLTIKVRDKIVADGINDETFFSPLALQQISIPLFTTGQLDDIDRQIITLTAQGYKIKSIANKVLLSEIAIKKSKSKIKEVLQIKKGGDQELLELCRALNFIPK